MTEENRGTVLEVENLTKYFVRSSNRFLTGRDKFAAVDHVSFSITRGEVLGLLGESGCGKSTLSRMLMHLIKPDEGRILLDGMEIQDMSEREFRKQRKKIQMVFQNPFDCLDPSRSVKDLLEEPLKLWEPDLTPSMRSEKIAGILHDCGLSENCVTKRPKEFSGGQLQRISLARALLVSPNILIADEIVSALDVSVQAQILELLNKLRTERNLSVLFITHDLSVARKMSDRVMVMKDGRILDVESPDKLFLESEDPYVKALAEAAFTFQGR